MATVKEIFPPSVDSTGLATTLRDITVGGRIRKGYQATILKIAQRAASQQTVFMRGNMLTSTQTTSLKFLDGGVSIVSGVFGPTSGMFWGGLQVKAFILYELGLSAEHFLRQRVPTHSELKLLVQEGLASSNR